MQRAFLDFQKFPKISMKYAIRHCEIHFVPQAAGHAQVLATLPSALASASASPSALASAIVRKGMGMDLVEPHDF